MKRIILAFLLLIALISCSKEDKIKVNCHGDCKHISFTIDDETGPIESNFTTTYTHGYLGDIKFITNIGTIKYLNSGNTYQVKIVIDNFACKYTVTINDESSCTSGG